MTGYFSPDAPRDAAQNTLGAPEPRRALKRFLRFGPSMVSLSALILAAPALAQTTLSSSTTTPQVTSKTGDLTINSGISVKPTSGTAVTIDSNNAVTNGGILEFQNLSNVTGVVIQGGHTGTFTNNGTIQVDDTTSRSINKSGIPSGPLDNGTNRYAIHIIGPGDFTGDIINATTGTGILVKGDTSAGIFAETNLGGALNNGGSLSVTGNNSFGIQTKGSVAGTVTLGGTISAIGQGTQAVNLGGDVGGQVLINGSVSATGFAFTTRSTDPNFLKQLPAEDLVLGGPTVTIGGSVAKGVLVDIASVDSTGAALTSTGTVSSFGSAPAIVIGGAAGKNITLGNVGTDVDAFGLEIKGNVIGSGVYDGIAANGVQVGVANGGTVDTTGGIHVSGTVGASAYAADATALHLNGAIAQVLRNDGAISATLSSDAAGATASALIIEAGSNTPVLQNANTITASVVGQQANVAAIVDKSGTLSQIENIGTIGATRTLGDLTQPVTGHATALDLHLNTTGVSLLQYEPTGGVLTPSITGSVTLGSGNNNVNIQAGTLTGDLDLGSGASTLTIDNGSTVTGALNAAGGTVALTVGTGTLQINNASQLKLTSLTLGGASSLIVTADPAVGGATRMDVAGTATIANGAKIGVRFNSLQQGTVTYTLIHATQLNAGTLDSNLLGSVPYLYNSSLQTNAAAGTVSATMSLKTAAQLALPTTTAGAYQAVINNIGRDTGLQGALLIQDNRTSLINFYNQLLPNHSGSLFNIMAGGVSAFGKPLDDRQDPVGGGFWMQETNVGVFANGQTDDPGYKGWSLGAVAGYEIPRTPLGILGVTFGASTNQVYQDATDAAENLHSILFDAGVYWRMTKGGFSANARVAGDYARVTSVRVIEVLGGDGLAVGRTADGRWNAFGFNARAMASYEAHLGRNIYLRPEVSLDYVRLAEGSYTETGGGNGMDLAVGVRTSSRASAFAGVAVGALYGPDRSWGPEALVGYRSVASETLGATTAKFVGGSDQFTLGADNIPGSGAVAHLSVKGENGSGGFAIETGAEARSGLNIYDLRVTGHLQF